MNLLTEKGIYPYDYMDSWDKFDEKELPTHECFYSELAGGNISDKDYKKTQIVWKHFELSNLGEYHDLYLKTDVLLLTDVFENFRTVFGLLWIRPRTLLYFAEFCMGCHVIKNRNKIGANT